MAEPVRTIRKYVPSDRPAVDELHRNHSESLWYADPDDEINFLTWVLEEDGKIVAAITARRTVEIFLMLDKTHGDPAKRWDIAKALFAYASERSDELGVREIHFGVPTTLRGYVRRLLKLGSIYLDNRFHLLMAAGSRVGG